jgi:4-amino-4-deoxy-L-arabinose transferase-like glycosyltransferase
MMAENYHSTNWNILCTKLNWDGPGPGYQGREFQTLSYLTALLYLLVGQHDWVGRAVAVMFGLWGIFALYQLVRRVWDEQRAVASAAVMALLPGSIFIERSFLPDPAMVALVTTATWLLVAYLQTDRWHYLILAS